MYSILGNLKGMEVLTWLSSVLTFGDKFYSSTCFRTLLLEINKTMSPTFQNSNVDLRYPTIAVNSEYLMRILMSGKTNLIPHSFELL